MYQVNCNYFDGYYAHAPQNMPNLLATSSIAILRGNYQHNIPEYDTNAVRALWNLKSLNIFELC